MDNLRVVYTLSDRDNMVIEAIRSIRTVMGSIPPSQIVVFFTPPTDARAIECFEEIGVDVRVRANEIAARPGSGSEIPAHYGSKHHVCSVDADSVIFLDCDTVVPGDITELVSDTAADFRCRHDYAWFGAQHPADRLPEEWHAIFDAYDLRPPAYVPQGGVLAFRNRAHERIQDTWRKYLDVPHPTNSARDYLPENVALALAVVEKDLEVDLMERREHVYEFERELCSDGVVYHEASPGEGRPQSVRGNLYLASLYLRSAFGSLRRRIID